MQIVSPSMRSSLEIMSYFLYFFTFRQGNLEPQLLFSSSEKSLPLELHSMSVNLLEHLCLDIPVEQNMQMFNMSIPDST